MPDLDLATVLPFRGVEKPLSHKLAGPVSAEDWAYAQTAPRETAIFPVEKIKAKHHTIARLVAQGRTTVEIANIMSMDRNRLDVLTVDPAFKELVAFYIEKHGEIFDDAAHRMQSLLTDTLEELQERMEDEKARKALGHDELMKQFGEMADRTGFGKQTKSMNVNVNVGVAGRLEAARQRLKALGATADE